MIVLVVGLETLIGDINKVTDTIVGSMTHY